MRFHVFLGTALLSAAAGVAQAQDWMPTAGLNAEFGGGHKLHLTARFGTAWHDPALAIPQALPLTNLVFDSRDGIRGTLLGLTLGAAPRGLHQDEGAIVEEKTETSYTWVWIALGAAVLASSIDVSKSEEHNNGSNDGDSSFEGGCNIASTSGSTVYVAGPNCPVVGDVHFPP